MLCIYFKAGTCEKGNKCKFSHDLDVGRKVEKRNLYEDSREEKANGTFKLFFFHFFFFGEDVDEFLLEQIRWRIGTRSS